MGNSELLIYFKNNQKFLYIFLPYIVIFVIHLLFFVQARQPIIVLDEYTQLSLARYFAGGNPIIFLLSPVVHFGYPLIISPLFLLFSDPAIIYKAIVFINFLLSSALFFPLFYLSRKLINLDNKESALFSFLVCIYPSFIVQSIFAWQDAIIFTLYSLDILLFYLFLDRKNYKVAFLFSFFTAYIYAVHVRMLPVVIMALLMLIILLFIRNKIRKQISFSILMLVIFLVGINIFKKYLVGIYLQGEILEYSISEMLSHLNFANWGIVFKRVGGQLWYLVVSSYGLFLAGLMFLFGYLKDNAGKNIKESFERNNFLVVLYLLLSSLGIFGVSVLFTAISSLPRPDFLVYGRYNEAFIAIFLLFGLVYFYKYKLRKINIIVITIIILGTALILNKETLFRYNNNSVNSIPGLNIWLYLSDNYLYIMNISIIIFLVFIILVLFFRKKYFYGFSFILLLFTIQLYYFYQYYNFFNHSQKDFDYLLKNNLLKQQNSISYDVDYYECQDNTKEQTQVYVLNNFYNFQWKLPQAEFKPFYSSQGDYPNSNLIIASACWQPTSNFEIKKIAEDQNGIQAIWIKQ